LAGTA